MTYETWVREEFEKWCRQREVYPQGLLWDAYSAGRASREPEPVMAEQLAQRFHETYERLAPMYHYETRKESAVEWERVPEKNRQLMIAVCTEVLASAAEREKELREVLDRGYLLVILLRTFADTRDPLDKDAARQMGEFMREAERVLGK